MTSRRVLCEGTLLIGAGESLSSGAPTERVSFLANSLKRKGVHMLRRLTAAGQSLTGCEIPGGWHSQYIIVYLDNEEAVRAALAFDSRGVASVKTFSKITMGTRAELRWASEGLPQSVARVSVSSRDGFERSEAH